MSAKSAHLQAASRSIHLHFRTLDLFNAALIAILLTSPFGWSVLLNFGGRYFPEAGLVLLFVVNIALDSRFIITLGGFLAKKPVLAWISLCGLLLLAGCVFHRQFFASYGDFRSSLILGLTFFLAKEATRDSETSGRFVKFLALTCTLSILANAVYYSGFSTISSVKQMVPTGIILLGIFLSLKYSSLLTTALVILISAYLLVTSSYRSNFVVVIFIMTAYLLASLQPISQRRIGATRMLDRLMLLAGVAGIITALPVLISTATNYLRSDPSRYYQSVVKVQQLQDALRAGRLYQADPTRAAYPGYVSDHFAEFLLPSGFGHEAIIYKWRSMWTPANEAMAFGNSVDGAHLFLAAHFGLALGLFLFIAVFWQVGWAALRTPLSEFFVRVLLLAAFGVFFVTFGGHMFAQMGVAIGSGLFLGVMSADPRPKPGPIRIPRRPAGR
jgi:hypothetical protein